jgi:hypothetical protein
MEIAQRHNVVILAGRQTSFPQEGVDQGVLIFRKLPLLL